jgi:hypothetical protein
VTEAAVSELRTAFGQTSTDGGSDDDEEAGEEKDEGDEEDEEEAFAAEAIGLLVRRGLANEDGQAVVVALGNAGVPPAEWATTVAEMSTEELAQLAPLGGRQRAADREDAEDHAKGGDEGDGLGDDDDTDEDDDDDEAEDEDEDDCEEANDNKTCARKVIALLARRGVPEDIGRGVVVALYKAGAPPAEWVTTVVEMSAEELGELAPQNKGLEQTGDAGDDDEDDDDDENEDDDEDDDEGVCGDRRRATDGWREHASARKKRRRVQVVVS